MSDKERVEAETKAKLLQFKEAHGLSTLKGVPGIVIATWLHPEQPENVRQAWSLGINLMLINLSLKGEQV